MEIPRRELFYQILCAMFCVIVVLANVISAKMVPLPFVQFSIPAGLVIYPLTFFMSALITEFYGTKRAKLAIYIAFAMNLVSFGILELALLLPTESRVEQSTFEAVLGLSGLRIFSSLTAFLIAQMVDVKLYALIRRWSGERYLWLRCNGASCISQMVDTIVIDLLFLYWGLGMGMREVLVIMIFSYVYKSLFSFSTTPLFYLFVLIRKNRRIHGAKLSVRK